MRARHLSTKSQDLPKSGHQSLLPRPRAQSSWKNSEKITKEFVWKDVQDRVSGEQTKNRSKANRRDRNKISLEWLEISGAHYQQ